MKTKRPLTLTAGILTIILNVIVALATAYLAFLTYLIVSVAIGVGSQNGQTPDADFMSAIIMLVELVAQIVLAIVMIVLSSIMLKNHKLAPADYKKKKGIFIAVAIILFLQTASRIYDVISVLADSTGDNLLFVVAYVLIIAVSLMSAIFIIVDYNKNDKLLAAAELETANISTPQTTVTASTTESTPTETPVAPAQEAPKAETTEDKLAKLNELKTNGVITEEEFETMKSKLMK